MILRGKYYFLGNRIVTANSVLRINVRSNKGILLRATVDGNKLLSAVYLCCARDTSKVSEQTFKASHFLWFFSVIFVPFYDFFFLFVVPLSFFFWCNFAAFWSTFHVLNSLCLVLSTESSMSAPGELSLRDCGTQLQENYLRPHLQKFTITTKEEDPISEDKVYQGTRSREEAKTKNECIQTGRFGPMGKKGVLKCQAIKYPSDKVLEGIAKRRRMPQMASCEVIKSRAKSDFSKWLLEEIKNPNTPEPRFKRLGNQLYARVYGPEFEPIE